MGRDMAVVRYKSETHFPVYRETVDLVTRQDETNPLVRDTKLTSGWNTAGVVLDAILLNYCLGFDSNDRPRECLLM
jgi:hypothetical protein